MVRLKDGLDTADDFVDASFNSTMVRLKALYREGIIMNLTKFQFHNGSIKSQVDNIIGNWLFQFQFHNGSIKSYIVGIVAMTTLMFQFHNGSIKRGSSGTSITFSSVSIPQWFD